MHRSFVPPLALRLLPFALSVLLLVGCADLNRAVSTGIDPLLGGPPVKAVAPSDPQPVAAAATFPPLPASSSGMSNAALAAGVSRPLEGGRDLRIGTPRGNNDAWGGQGPGPSGDSPGAVLRQPETAIEPVTQREVAPVANPPTGASSRGTSFEQAQGQLAARGVIWQRLETTGDAGDWHFTCSVPNRQNPRLRRTHDAHARDPLAAIQAVLDQMDKEK